MCSVSAMQNQNNEKARDASMARSMARGQNNENNYEGNTCFVETKEKQMTYHEALLGLDKL